MSNKLKKYFPMIREKEELLSEIKEDAKLWATFKKWPEEKQEEFLNLCTGVKGIKVMYDSFAKEAVNPEYAPERLESLLSELLKRKIKILKVLPNDSTRIADETSLLITDIIVELDDRSLANVEIQKIGSMFPGPRSACYSSDMLLRQYKRVRAKQGNDFSYDQIKNVYLIVIYEKSPKEFKKLSDTYYHHSKQIFDTGLEMDLLQEYIMIPLDIYHKRMQNKPIETLLEAWLMFLSSDNPDRIIELITKYPEFKPMYENLYQMCLNTERVMDMFFSEELRIMDRNMFRYMMEEQQKEIDEQKEVLDRQKVEIDQQKAEIHQKNAEIAYLKEQLNKLSQKE